MGRLTPFLFTHSTSLLHKLDTRYKLAMVCLISVGLIKAMFPSLAVTALIMILLMLNSGIKPLNCLWQMRYFFILLFFVFISRALTIQGKPLFHLFWLPISGSGIKEGALISTRLLIIMLLGMVFSHTTRPSSIKSAAAWFLKPLPFIPEKKASLMIGLAIRFLPVIFEQAEKVSDAQKSRCGDNQKNPVKKAARLVMPILKKTFQTADNLALAMEARCFSEKREDQDFNKSGFEIICLGGAILLTIILVLF